MIRQQRQKLCQPSIINHCTASSCNFRTFSATQFCSSRESGAASSLRFYNKLDAGSSSNSEEIIKSPDNIYFAKYLTNQKLLEIQRSDANFRRYIPIQFLTTFQYLTLNVRFKSESQVLADVQNNFVHDAEKQVMDLVFQTLPNGSTMAKVIGQILSREECCCG